MELRLATIKDADLLLEWRSDPETMKASHSTGKIDRDGHIAWLSASLANPDRQLFIWEEGEIPVGTARADLSDGVWELSWTVAPSARGHGVGKRMVSELAQQITKPIRAEVKTENTASARIAENAGMEFVKEDSGILHYARPG